MSIALAGLWARKKHRLTRKESMVRTHAAAFGTFGSDARRQANSTVIARPVKMPNTMKFQPAPCQMPETRKVTFTGTTTASRNMVHLPARRGLEFHRVRHLHRPC